ncbi:response regulator [Alkalinema sp. FACHB-956]|uniref:response regulator transcription factor n=1 Tax=Alkalinema sp. FACHB-956 TaxID=2692768 RepID=UPI0016857A0C|nr:response regulator [Alkalinema sp. FACHB-956]MBD2327034.1 response regulator [Alkalinema sp. FACHB-956]
MKTILVIEDDKNVRECLIDLLEVEGFQTISACDGPTGLELAQQQQPDMVLCDVHMPEVDGFTVLHQMRQNPDTSALPFIFLTARTTKADLRRGMELGADDYLFKPFTPDELFAAIATRLDKYAALTQHLNTGAGEDISNHHNGLLNYFYQELRNPLSNLNVVIHLLQEEHQDWQTIATNSDYAKELAILQQVCALRETLTPESAALLSECPISSVLSHSPPLAA